MSSLGELVRGQFAAWLRTKRPALFTDPACACSLGLDDTTLRALSAADHVVVTLPHASPNVFVPRLGVAWYARHLQDRDDSLMHLRIVLSHVNFSDLGWRPYAWWYIDAAGRLTRETLFTRNKKAKHTIVVSQPALSGVPAATTGVDRRAAESARHAVDRAGSYTLIMAEVERAAGLSIPGRTVYVPLHLVVEFFRDAGGRPDAAAYWPWVRALLADGAGAREVDESGRLIAAADPARAFVLDNPSNLALLSLLGCTGVIGGAKMAAYWDDVRARTGLADAGSSIASVLPRVLRLPNVDYNDVLPASPGLAGALAAAGIPNSQGLALAEHGDFAAQLDPFDTAQRGGGPAGRSTEIR